MKQKLNSEIATSIHFCLAQGSGFQKHFVQKLYNSVHLGNHLKSVCVICACMWEINKKRGLETLDGHPAKKPRQEVLRLWFP